MVYQYPPTSRANSKLRKSCNYWVDVPDSLGQLPYVASSWFALSQIEFLGAKAVECTKMQSRTLQCDEEHGTAQFAAVEPGWQMLKLLKCKYYFALGRYGSSARWGKKL